MLTPIPSTAKATSIWYFALGYFLCYVPYSALTKALSKGWITGAEPIPGAELLPVSALASVVGMFGFLTAMRWWQFAGHRTWAGMSLPWPGRWTFLSGLCTAGIIGTTTLAYTFEGVSIVFIMLLMRGGVLIIAPIVDAFTGRRTRWFSWCGLILSLFALLVAFSEDGGYSISVICAIDVFMYLACYFVRLRLMTRLAKSSDLHATKRYFVEEQLVGGPVLAIALALWAWVGQGTFANQLAAGFGGLGGLKVIGTLVLIGLLSQGTGIFGGLILLDKGENTFTVPVNRSSSILAGVVASVALSVWLDAPWPSGYELWGAFLVVMAIVCLSVPPMLEKRRVTLESSARRA